MTNVTLGVGGILGHDANAALVVDGRLVAASQEERYSRRKHDGSFPKYAIHDCLAIAGLNIADVDVVVFADKPLQELLGTHLDRASNALTWHLGRIVPEAGFAFLREARAFLPGATFQYAWHHLSHAALAFATSPFERAAFLCVDGKGDDVNATIGVVEGRHAEVRYELGYGSGLGMFYSLISEFLGFPPQSEYKVMGLAPYGEPVYSEQIRALVATDDQGALRFNMERASWSALYAALREQVGWSARSVGDPITEHHADLAASMQYLFEEEVIKMARFAKEVTGEEYLLFCGGCAQNCVAAGKLQALGLFADVHTSPAAGDMGTGLGAALLYRNKFDILGDGKVDVQGMELGSLPGLLPEDANAHRILHQGDIFDATAQRLADGAIIGWVRGRMEYGARALGARSILADPRLPGVQATLNQRIKRRESFRPFAPAILADEAGAWFDTRVGSDYMQRVAQLKPEHRYEIPDRFATWQERLAHQRCAVPAVIHVDFSSRLQTVNRDRHPAFHRLLTRFNELTGIPMLVNTSFNVAGEPIVRTAADAWRCFTHTDMDYLVVGDELFRHPSQAGATAR